MVRNGNNVSICIWYDMVFTVVRNGMYEMNMVRNDYYSSAPQHLNLAISIDARPTREIEHQCVVYVGGLP